MQLETFEKLILHRNFRSALQGNLASTFDPDHMQLIHQKLCDGLGHRDGELKSGEFRVAEGAARLLGTEANKMAPHLMASSDKHLVAERAAYVMGRIEAMQPFHSLNSMVGKLYSHNLAQTAGFKIDWPNMDKETLSSAVESAKKGDSQKLVQQIEAHLKPMFEPDKKTGVATRIGSDFESRVAEFKAQREPDSTNPEVKVRM